MKKIFNWTIGSFFRTIGRIIAFLVLGGLAAYILSKSDFDFSRLFMMRINAATLENWSVSESRYRYDQAGTPKWSDWSSTPHTWSPTYPVQKLAFRVKASNGLSTENTYVLKFGYLPTPDSLGAKSVIISSNIDTTLTDYFEDITCSNWPMNSNNYYLVTCSFTPKSNYSSSTFLYVTIDFYQAYQTSFRSYMYGFEERLGISSVVTQQTNIINNTLNNIESQINDDDTSIAQGAIGQWFSSFTTNDHGLTSIITAPLNAIESLTSATCSPLVLPLPFVNQNLTLPCMRSIYVSNFGSFMNLYDIITLGIVSYWVMVRIFTLVKDFKNPDHDEIEVVDL